MDPRGTVVLLVEDDEDTRDLLGEVLEGFGCSVRGVETVATARAGIAAMKPDVLVADYSLPDGTGADILQGLSSSRPRLCILLTGFDPDRVASSGFDVVLRKPVGADAVIAEIRKCAELSEQAMTTATASVPVAMSTQSPSAPKV